MRAHAQVHLGPPISWPAAWGAHAQPPPCAHAEGHGILRLHLAGLPLALLAHLSGDPALQQACGVLQPFQKLARSWALAVSGHGASETAIVDTADPNGRGSGRGAGGEAGSVQGGTSGSAQGAAVSVQGIARSVEQDAAEGAGQDAAGFAAVAKLLGKSGRLCQLRGLAWVVQQLLSSFMLGETPQQVGGCFYVA